MGYLLKLLLISHVVRKIRDFSITVNVIVLFLLWVTKNVTINLFNPIRPGLFSCLPGPQTQRPGCQISRLPSTDWNETLQSQYSYESMPDANLSLVAFLVLEI